MITENQLNEAIAEMNGQRRPDASTCIKLASYYTIKNELFPKKSDTIIPAYSTDSGIPNNDTIVYNSDTDFGKAVFGKNTHDVLSKLDSIMSALYVIDPPLYKRVLRDLADD